MAIYSYKKNGKTHYRVRVYLGLDKKTGEQMYVSRSGFKKKSEAQVAEGILIEQHQTKVSGRRKFIEVFEDWLALYKLRVKESSYHITKRRMESHLISKIGEYYVDAIELRDVQKIVNEWSKQFVRFKEMKSYMSSIFDEAERQGLISDNPCRLIVLPNPKKSSSFEKESPEEFENFYDKEELRDFFVAAAVDLDIQWYAFFRLLAFTGLRRGEALALEWKDLTGTKLSVTKTMAHGEGNKLIVQTPKTPKSKRAIDLDTETIQTLKKWRKDQVQLFGVLPIMFNNSKKGHFSLSSPKSKLEQLYQKNPDLKVITSHGFRHTHCSMLFESGATISEVQKRLGHADIKTTMNIYTHVSKEKKEEAIERLVNYLGF